MSHNLTNVTDTIAASLAAKLPTIETISADRPPKNQRSLKVPAIYLEIEDISPMQEAGDSRLLCDVRWQAHCLVDPNTPRAELALRDMAAQVAVALHEIRRPIPGHGHIRLVRAGEDPFSPTMDTYLSWAVEFSIEIALGELEPEAIRPTVIMIGQAPSVGDGHAPDYEQIV